MTETPVLQFLQLGKDGRKLSLKLSPTGLDSPSTSLKQP